MSNPQDKSCCRPVGPDCQFLSIGRHSWCTHWRCSPKRGMINPGVNGCPYYKPEGSTHEEILEEIQGGFWIGAIVGVMMGGGVVLIIFTLLEVL